MGQKTITAAPTTNPAVQPNNPNDQTYRSAQQGTSGTQRTNEGKEPGFGKADQENQKRLDERAGRR